MYICITFLLKASTFVLLENAFSLVHCKSSFVKAILCTSEFYLL
ncbi:hypothetical protein HMPREF2738_01800 [Clostridiales bacterium KLE1615]|nr:hypothetical protein HMPREF2738_01800 [Clostridiales bacterium KLE1615]